MFCVICLVGYFVGNLFDITVKDIFETVNGKFICYCVFDSFLPQI